MFIANISDFDCLKMSENVIIRVEGLGKKYSIRHQRNERYTRFARRNNR